MELGFPEGGVTAAVHRRASDHGLSVCPLELGPHMRLQTLDQPEAPFEASRHRAPPGSITIASAPLSSDPAVPQGFYLRRVDGTLWLRGYRCAAEHVWSAGDRLLFCRR